MNYDIALAMALGMAVFAVAIVSIAHAMILLFL